MQHVIRQLILNTAADILKVEFLHGQNLSSCVEEVKMHTFLVCKYKSQILRKVRKIPRGRTIVIP